MRGGDEVQEDQRVEQAQPDRLGLVDAARAGQPRQVERDEQHPAEGEQPEQEQRGDRGGAGDPVDPGRQAHPQRAVRRRRGLPDPVRAVGEVGVEDTGAVHVGVDPVREQPALRDVAVDVAAEEHRRERHRQAPPQRQAVEQAAVAHLAGADDVAQAQPRLHEQGDSDDDDELADERVARVRPDRAEDGQGPDAGGQRDPPGAERPQRHQHRAGQAGPGELPHQVGAVLDGTRARVGDG